MDADEKNLVSPGTLYVVSTPIGNLEDMTYRAVKILSAVDLIAAEDTRTSGVLLKRYDIHKPMVSYYSYNEARRTPELIERLKAGASIALISDAGTPGISDPAYRIVHCALEEHIPVVPVPGASAILSALVVAGLPMEKFVFEGFLPVKKGRATRMRELKTEQRTMVFYESPHRLLKTLREFLENFGDRPAAVARELTKKFEETRRGKLSELLDHFTKSSIKGEFVIVLSGAGEDVEDSTQDPEEID
jgi:16S rRNA (cytidine1402-2'-O)-methyltransferase